MPELPEVETVIRALRPQVSGLKVESAQFTLPRLLLESTPQACAARIRNQTVQEASRRGKYALLRLDRDTLVFHLGMTGRLTWLPEGADTSDKFARTLTGYEIPIGPHSVDRHTHAVLSFSGGGRLLFRDPRTFGCIFLVPGKDLHTHARFASKGPEPLEIGKKEFLSAWPATSLRPVKALLLDQAFVAGIGNIYADEALFRAKIHPAMPVKKISLDQAASLHRAIQAVLKKAISNQGTTFSDYRKPDGSPGKNYERLQAYGRGGQPCRACGTCLVKIVLAQRGTVFCPLCQGKIPTKK